MAKAAVRSKAVVMLLLTFWFNVTSIVGVISFVLYFVERYFMSILVLQSS